MSYGMDFQGGDGGGGYTNNNSNSGGGPSTQDAPSSQGRPRRSYDEQTLIPLTIRMALRSSTDATGGDGSLSLEDGRKVASIKLVGAARSVNDNSTNVVYGLEDGTGLIEVKQWLDDNDCSVLQHLRQQTLQEHAYIKIIGQIKDYDGKKIVVANSVRPLASSNEITHHMLDVVYSAEGYKRADSIVSAPVPVNSGVGFGGPKVAQQSGASGNPLREAVLTVFRTADASAETGVHIQECVNALSSSHPEAEVRKMVEGLSEEGHIYSTVSDEHFQFAH